MELVGTLAPISATGFSTFQPDGKVVVAGSARGLCKGGLAIKVTRRMLDNAMDPTFNSPSFFFGNGMCGRPDLPQAVTIESNGQIVVGGIAAMPNFQVAFGVARLLADGSLDATFGNGGRVTTMFNGRADQIDALAVQHIRTWRTDRRCTSSPRRSTPRRCGRTCAASTSICST